VAGPLWLGKIVDAEFCRLMEKAVAENPLRNGWKIRKLLASTKSEAEASITYYVLDRLCKKLALPVPSIKKVADELRKKGFQAVRTHFDTRGIKTDAPISIIKLAIEEALA